MKYRVVRVELAPNVYNYRILAPWNAFLSSKFLTSTDATRWIRDNIRKKP